MKIKSLNIALKLPHKARAEADPNKATAARWLKVAEEWSRMADVLERRINPKT